MSTTAAIDTKRMSRAAHDVALAMADAILDVDCAIAPIYVINAALDVAATTLVAHCDDAVAADSARSYVHRVLDLTLTERMRQAGLVQ
jgi:hypothetical protein